MSIEGGPKPDKPLETSAPESEKKERLVLPFNAIKDIIIYQIGNKADINLLEIEEATEGVKLKAEIDAGILGGQISIEGLIVNILDGISVRDLNIDARGYIKSRIENSLSNFGLVIKKYFEKKYGKTVSHIQIVDSSLIIDLENTYEVDMPRESESNTQIEQLLEIIDKIKDPWERIGNIETYCKDLIKLKRYDDARKIAGLLKNQKNRDATMANIDMIEKLGE